MPSSCDYNCSDLPVHEQIACRDYLHGRISAAAALNCDHTITDYTSASEWNTNINNGSANIIRNIVGEKPEPSPVEVENPNGCGFETFVDTFDRTIEFTDYNVSAANQTYYDGLNGRTTDAVFYYCQDNNIEVVLNVTWVITDISPRSKKELRNYHVIAKWTSRTMPQIFDAPAGIFTNS